MSLSFLEVQAAAHPSLAAIAAQARVVAVSLVISAEL